MLKRGKNIYIKVAVVLAWIAIWQVVAMVIGNPLILSSPVQAVTALLTLCGDVSFWRSVYGSFSRIAFGFLLAAVAAVLLSVAAYRFTFVREFLAPPMTVLKTVPVASFIILLLISLKTKDSLSSIICFMMSLPVLYTNVLAGLSGTDPKLLEMARVFRVGRFRRIVYLYGYRSLGFFATGCKVALGLCFKSGVAAELIGFVQGTIGNELYYAKLYLMMDLVFAWTIVIVVLSLLFEAAVLGLLWLLKRGLER